MKLLMNFRHRDFVRLPSISARLPELQVSLIMAVTRQILLCPPFSKGGNNPTRRSMSLSGIALFVLLLALHSNYFLSFSFSSFSISIFIPFSAAVLSTQRFKESIAKEISSNLLLMLAKSLISSSVIFPSFAI